MRIQSATHLVIRGDHGSSFKCAVVVVCDQSHLGIFAAISSSGRSGHAQACLNMSEYC